MRVQYYTLSDMYRLKGGYLKKNESGLKTWEAQKQVFSAYLASYPFLMELKYATNFHGLIGGSLDERIKTEIERYYNGKEAEYASRIESIYPRLVAYDTSKEIDDLESELTYVKGRYEAKLDVISDLISRTHTRQVEANKIERELVDLEEKLLNCGENAELRSVKTTRAIAHFGRSGFFIPVASDGYKYVFITKPFTLKRRLTEVSFGSLVVTINPDQWIDANPFQNNLFDSCNRYYHPNISQGGEICWGNMTDEAYRLIKSGKDWGRVADILERILTVYTPTTPYVKFDSFLRRENRGVKTTRYSDNEVGFKLFKNSLGLRSDECVFIEENLKLYFPNYYASLVKPVEGASDESDDE